MSKVTMDVSWHFSLTPADTVLMLKALGGRLTTEEDKAAAKRLGDTMTSQRSVQAEHFAREMAKHDLNRRKGGGGVGRTSFDEDDHGEGDAVRF